MSMKSLLCRDYAAVAALAEKMAPRCAAGSPDQLRWRRLAVSYRQLTVELEAYEDRAELLSPLQPRAFF